MKTVGVSVIVPAYNVAAYLPTAVASALEGQGENVEVVVVDDASTDTTAKVIEQLAEKDSRVRSVLLPVNGGPSVARNAGIEAGRGEWLAILDAVDWWGPGRLPYLLKLAEATGADFVSDDIHLVTEGADSPWISMYRL